ETLLLLDFVFIIYMENNKLKGILQLSKGLLPDIQKVLIANCVSISKIKKDISKDQIDILITKENLNHNIAEEDFNFKFNENVVIHNNQDINLVMGSFSKTEEFPKQLSFNLLKYINDIINKAFLYYSKIEENQVIFKAFCQFLPAPIINDLLLKDSEKALLTGQKRNIVVLFSHIHHFDQIVELNEPQRVVDFLNSHFSRMVKIIQSYGGTVDKFIGDAIFAIFGAPISYIDNAQRAADAAADMIKEFNSTSLERIRLPALGISAGVGLNEGEAIIGNIGCADKFDYTAIGDTVNLAARLESLTKFYKQDILVSKVVAQKIDGKNYCRLIDRAKVKGKNEPTEIYSLILRSNRYTTEWKSLYNRGFKMYTLGNWYTAADYFNEALEIIPSDPVCKLLLSRCLEFQINIPENWDGSVALDFK
ncbi:MAG: adenylate/guanylate cyclase domain-containing protein, partial [Spirochaetaceae bacterium]|nr:adenylate/guanylate cyclase domain-containing protein [Spirochaetaceae bacterium]